MYHLALKPIPDYFPTNWKGLKSLNIILTEKTVTNTRILYNYSIYWKHSLNTVAISRNSLYPDLTWMTTLDFERCLANDRELGTE